MPRESLTFLHESYCIIISLPCLTNTKGNAGGGGQMVKDQGSELTWQLVSFFLIFSIKV